MNIRNVLVSGIAAGILILVVSMIVNALIQMVLPYNVLELGGMRSVEDPIMMLFFLHYWVIGFVMAILYDYTKTAFQGTVGHKGTLFGLLMWLVYVIPSAFVVYTSMNYPIGFTIGQVFGGLIYMLAAGIVIARLSG